MFELGEQVCRAAHDYETEVALIKENTSLLRIANSNIVQNTEFNYTLIGVRIRKGKRASVGFSYDYSKEGILNIVKELINNLKYVPEDPYLPPFYSETVTFTELDLTYEEVKNFSPDERAEIAGKILKLGKDKVEIFGTVSSGYVEYAYINTAGRKCYQEIADTHVTINLKKEPLGSGWIQYSTTNPSLIDIEKLFDKVYKKAIDSCNPQEIEVGKYPVLLEPLAFASLLFFLSYYGFSARAVIDKKSPLTNKFGSQIFNPNLTLEDTPLNRENFPMIFDWEGVPKRNLTLIDKGVPITPVYDLKTSLIATGKIENTTGHCLNPFYSFPLPLHLTVKEGEISLENLINDLDEYILVTKLWYVNLIDPMSFTLTGMTRDGTFLMKGNKVVKPLKNLRFTQSLLNLLEGEFTLTKEKEVIAPTSFYDYRFPHGTLVPYVYFPSFTFTGITEF